MKSAIASRNKLMQLNKTQFKDNFFISSDWFLIIQYDQYFLFK